MSQIWKELKICCLLSEGFHLNVKAECYLKPNVVDLISRGKVPGFFHLRRRNTLLYDEI